MALVFWPVEKLDELAIEIFIEVRGAGQRPTPVDRIDGILDFFQAGTCACTAELDGLELPSLFQQKGRTCCSSSSRAIVKLAIPGSRIGVKIAPRRLHEALMESFNFWQ